MVRSTLFKYSDEAQAAAAKIPAGTVSEQSHRLGMEGGEPLIVAMDCLLKYAEAYKQRMECPLSEDYVLGDYWKDSICNLRKLLNGDGAVAMKMNRSTDSKDNGAVDRMFWDAIRISGFKESDVD